MSWHSFGGCYFLAVFWDDKPSEVIMRVKITLQCTECKQRNYDTMKNKKNDPDRLEMSKYCRFCKKHTAHKEAK
jgi:large subunit ribosomal protein L33